MSLDRRRFVAYFAGSGLASTSAGTVVRPKDLAEPQGDRWYGGMTRNPWRVEQGASGSSPGPGSTTAAGLVGFAIVTEMACQDATGLRYPPELSVAS